ncbi:cytochrome b/b6 domain-containing protein [Streptomyces sp. NPDC059861]|uniref:cytochrome b/b6 domain-containing protein n=1 Tax=Streptomyces sp. NPDC059861 TaxID=3346974 RepID=UPI003649E963
MNPRRSTSSLPQPGRSAYGVATAVTLVLIPVAVLVGGDQFREFLDFGAGVLSLVTLTGSVLWGLFAQDRILLNARQRILGQAVHRTMAVASIAFLLLHITTKLALDHVGFLAVIIPFSLGVAGSAGLIGLGSAAALLMIFVGITGALRGAFASPAPVASRWRAMHNLAYPAWCAALVHGLFAGREAKPVFVTLYGLSLVAVMAALALRSAPRSVKRQVADRVGALLGTQQPPGREDLDASRARVAGESALPGYEKALPGYERQRPAAGPTAPSYAPSGASARPSAAETTGGFAAAYRAVGNTPRTQQSFADQTARMEVPDHQPTEAFPRLESPSGSWPIPSPPPVGEAPPSAYDPLQDTGYNIPAYGNSGAAGYGSSDVYDTGEMNAAFGTYYPDDTYNNSGPATETLPGASYDFDAPGSGEPWNTPSGGFK